MNVFVPVTEELMERLGLTPEVLVPFDLDYEILRPGEDFSVKPPAGEVGSGAGSLHLA